MKRVRRSVGGLVLVSAVLALGTAGCSDDKSDEAARINVEGRAEIGAPGEDIDDVTGEHSVRFGERVKIREGTATVDLAGDNSLSLKTGSHIELKGVDVDDVRKLIVVVLAGDVLVTAPGEPVGVEADGTVGAVQGAARFSKGLSLTVGSYNGAVELSSAGTNARVIGLRQVVIPAAGLFPAKPSPLEYAASDPWDRLLLGDAIELGNELLARSQGFSAQVSREDLNVDFFRALLPALASEPAFEPSLLGAPRPAGETMVGAAIALLGTRGTFPERWQNVFSFRGDNAQWGLVALDQGVLREPLLREIDAAIERGPAIFGVEPPGESGGPGGLPTPPRRTTPGTGPGGTGTTRPGGGSTPSTPGSGGTTSSTVPGQTTAPPPAPGPLNTGVPLVDETGNALVETLSGLLSALGLA